MTLSPKLWMFAALVAVTRGPYATGQPAAMHVRHLILGMMRDDRAYGIVLSERVKLSVDDVPHSVQDLLPSLDDVDPMTALRELVGLGDYYSGDKLSLGVLIVGSAVKCMAYKRVAVHILLIAKMLDLDTEVAKYTVRASVFAHVIPRGLDMVSRLDKRYTGLLPVYDLMANIASQVNEQELKTKYTDSLNAELQTLNAEIAKYCSKSAMHEYYGDLNLRMPDGSDPQVITAEHTVADDLTFEQIMDLLKASEIAMFNQYDDLPLLRNFSPGAWKSVLKHKDLPTKEDGFERTARPSPYHVKVAGLDRFWEDRIAKKATETTVVDEGAAAAATATE